MRIEDTDKYVLDVQRTLISNITYMAFILVIGVFVVTGAQFMGTIESEEAKLLGIIVWMFASVKLVGGLYSPNLEYKPRKEE